VRLAALLLTGVGVVVLFLGTAKGSPLAFFGTSDERAAMHDGRRLMLAATALLVLAGALLAARGALVRALLVASPGVVATALVYAFPKASIAWLAFVVLVPAAVAAALTALTGPGR
jgi:hypothetical protein